MSQFLGKTRYQMGGLARVASSERHGRKLDAVDRHQHGLDDGSLARAVVAGVEREGFASPLLRHEVLVDQRCGVTGVHIGHHIVDNVGVTSPGGHQRYLITNLCGDKVAEWRLVGRAVTADDGVAPLSWKGS